MSDELMELPEGWKWTQVSEVSELISGQHILSEDYSNEPIGISYLTGPADFSDRNPVISKWTTKPKVIAKRDDVLVTVKGNGVGKTNILDIEEAAISRQLMAIRATEAYPSYFFHFFQANFDNLQRLSTGSTVPGIDRESILSISIPLPPLNEQKRIVAAIESLRERSQKARSALSAIPELCDKFRQSVLAAAFRGDLTADWREQNPDVEHKIKCLQQIEELGRNKNKTEQNRAERIKHEEWFFTLKDALPPEWLEVNFMDITWLITCGVAKKPDYVEEGVPFLSAQNAKPFKANLNDIRFISEKDFKKFTVGGKPERNDILYSRVGAKFGEAAKVIFDFDFAIYVSLTLIKPIHSLIDSDFLVAFLNSPYGTVQAHGGILGSGIQNLNVENVRHYRVPLPPLAEQHEIARRINSLFGLVDTLEQTHQKLKDFLDLLDRSILAKAFRGELVEQDPNDEPASVLLERICAEREQQIQGKAKKPGKKGQRTIKAE